MDKLTAWKRLNELGVQKTLTEVDTALATIDQAPIQAKHSARVSHEIWDGVSSVNGIPAETIRFHHPSPVGGVAYLIRVDGAVRTIQPYMPGEIGFVPILPGNADQIAAAETQRLVTSYADDEVFDLLLEKVLV